MLAGQVSAGAAPPLRIEEVGGRVRIASTSWVGVVRLETLEIVVAPKLVGEALGVVRMIDYASGLDALKELAGVRRLATDGADLADLVGWLLALESDRLVRAGLLRDYVAQEQPLPFLRGRLRVLEQARRRYGSVAPLECRFDELETDITENRWLAAGLDVARRVCRLPAVRERALLQYQIISGACDPAGFDLDDLVAFEYHRRNEHYRAAHGWARLLLESGGIRDLYAAGTARSFVFMIDMNRLFEHFVTRLLEDAFTGTDVRVRAQFHDPSLIWNERTGVRYGTAIPDVLLERDELDGRRRLPIDIKYKLYDERRVDQSDLYQSFFYAQAYAQLGSRGRAVIVYPSAEEDGASAIGLRSHEGQALAHLSIRSIDVPAALDELRSDVHHLLGRIRGTFGPEMAA